MKIHAEISPGELFDKMSILEIKRARIQNEEKLRNIQLELDLLKAAYAENISSSPRLVALYNEIKRVNEQLWEIEDDIRTCERHKDFGEAFVRLARSVYHTNDKRAAIKKGINEFLGAHIKEEKSYASY